eukprot:1606583-Pleurochrysis_carterae.AAC.3
MQRHVRPHCGRGSGCCLCHSCGSCATDNNLGSKSRDGEGLGARNTCFGHGQRCPHGFARFCAPAVVSLSQSCCMRALIAAASVAGAFAYSQEDGTVAASMEEQIDENLKQARVSHVISNVIAYAILNVISHAILHVISHVITPPSATVFFAILKTNFRDFQALLRLCRAMLVSIRKACI